MGFAAIELKSFVSVGTQYSIPTAKQGRQELGTDTMWEASREGKEGRALDSSKRTGCRTTVLIHRMENLEAFLLHRAW